MANMRYCTKVQVVMLCMTTCTGCQTTIVPPAGSEVIQNGGVTEIVPRADPPPVQAICLVRARLFRGLVGVPCASLAQEFKP